MIRASKPLLRLLIPGQYSPFRRLHAGSRRRRYSKNDNDDDDKNDKGTHLHLYKSKGQHLLTNQRILDTIVRKSAIEPTDTVLEIGPGTGNLTVKLLEAASKVFAIEIDSRMVEILDKRALESGLQDRLTVIRKDALKAEFPLFDLVVANIPYNISSPLVAKLVFGPIQFRSATLLLQKEFARRLLAKPGDSEFNRLAVNVTLVADVEHVMDVSKREFVPCPKVDSSVVIIRPKAQVPDVNMEEWLAFTRTCFGKKNKTLGATFKQKKKVAELLNFSDMAASNAEYNDGGDDDESADSDGEEDCSSSSGSSEMGVSPFKEKIMKVLKSGCFDGKRPSKMSNEELLRLLAMFNDAGVYFHDKSNTKCEDINCE
ncbi:hypothetical protein G4B88_016938 [Cannabis sativa]|uniref:rRNA adenine N(6)-methyltransferase n=1 Tax=Cannabis sativa TaxID=3483 RepID=A0A7J6FMK3_CANSA|nr:hypothetical protein G4B88_016938 [Cannabis sativa]